jgi:hypothetical protein
MTTLLQRAIQAIQTGDTATGKQLLTQIIQAEPDNELAWLWLSQVALSDAERRACLEQVLRINPLNTAAKRGLTLLQQKSEPQVWLPETPVPPRPALSNEAPVQPLPTSAPVPVPEPARRLSPALLIAGLAVFGCLAALLGGVVGGLTTLYLTRTTAPATAVVAIGLPTGIVPATAIPSVTRRAAPPTPTPRSAAAQPTTRPTVTVAALNEEHASSPTIQAEAGSTPGGDVRPVEAPCTEDPAVRGQATFFCMDSQAGDYIGQGHTWIITNDDAKFSARLTYHGGVEVSIRTHDGWTLTFGPPDNDQLKVGVYDEAERFAFQSPTHPGLDVSGAGRGCNELSGRFQLLDFAYDLASGEVQRLAINFVQHCEGGPAALTGAFRYNIAPPPNQEPAPPPTITPTPVPLSVPFCTDAARDLGDKNFLCMSSQGGDYIGQGRNWIITDQDGTFQPSPQGQSGVGFFIRTSDSWLLGFAAPEDEILTPRIYERAERSPFNGPRRPGLSISGAGRGCNQLTGRFEILDFAVDPTDGTLLRLTVTFEQHCEGMPAALFGMLHYVAPEPATPTPTP